MGVALLWKELEDAEQHETLLNLSADAFQQQPARGLRLGIDCSLWLFHARKMQTLPEEQIGADADLRMLFYRVAKMYRLGVLPFFVFDGPERPQFKRGGRVMRGGGSWAKKEKRMQRILDAFGFPWRYARGEAEADLAATARRGEIDAVLTDDVDTLIFGAPWIIRNGSESLSSNKAATKKRADAQAPVRDERSDEDGDDDGPLFQIKETPFCEHSHRHYNVEYLEAHYGFKTDELVLVALLSGGDYDVEGCADVGPTVAMAMVECGFGRQLVDAYWALREDKPELRAHLHQWRSEVAQEMRTNSQKKLSSRRMKAADELESNIHFPSITILKYYLEPIVSDDPPPQWNRYANLEELARLVQENFEWGNDEVKQKLRNNIYQGLAMAEFREAALAMDAGRRMPSRFKSADESIFSSITDERCSLTTMYCPSYRVELSRANLDDVVSAALPKDDPFPIPTHVEDQVPGRRTKPIPPPTTSEYRHWLPVAMVQMHPRARNLARDWKIKVEAAQARKAELEEKRRQRAEGRASSVMLGSSPQKSSPVKASSKRSKTKHASSNSTGSIDFYLQSTKSSLGNRATSKSSKSPPALPPPPPLASPPKPTAEPARVPRPRRDAADEWLDKEIPPPLDLKALFGKSVMAGPSERQTSRAPPQVAITIIDSEDEEDYGFNDEVLILSSSQDQPRKKRSEKGKGREVECIVID